MAIGAAIGAAFFAVASVSHQRKARKERRRAAEIARRRERLQTRRANIENIEEFRTQVGQIENISAQTGGLGGSGQLGAQSSLTSQVAANITFNEQLQSFAEAEARRLEKAAYWDWRSNAAATGAQISSSFA